MLFASWQFGVFFAVVVSIYFSMPPRWRWALLLGASYFFYMCSVPAYALLLLGSTVIDYVAALRMAAAGSHRHKKMWLAVSLLANLGLLFSFKYYNFFAASIESLGLWTGLGLHFPLSGLILPVGISFYTFQTLSYSIDVYRGTLQPERHFGRYALYVSFFPQLVAGPIERAASLLPQFRRHHDFDAERVASGLRQMTWGLFKKVVIADNLAVLANTAYNDPQGLAGVHLAIATVFFAFQIYCDFSGYSDIAIGAARVLGFGLMTNFNQPYTARSVSEFWSRWHISLSTWFRDYVYIPLGGSRVSVQRWQINLIIVFLVSGLWHGAKWTFVIWGALHACYMVASPATKPWRAQLARALRLDRVPRLQSVLQRLAVFGLVCMAWVFFRANSVNDAFYILGRLPSGWDQLLQAGALSWICLPLRIAPTDLVFGFGLIALLLTAEAMFKVRGGHWGREIAVRFWPVRWAVYGLLLLSIINLGTPKPAPFIYFQF